MPVPDGQRVLLYVQHLLGIGHLQRFAVLSRALSTAGFEVLTVIGGPPSPGLNFGAAESVQLPPLRAADVRFSGLVDQNGRAVDRRWLERRRDRLLALAREFEPDAVLIESFPFGRRQLRFELIPLLEMLSARPRRPLILSCVRDILQQRRPCRLRETAALVERFFDAVLVHGDPNLVTLDRSFPLLPELSKPVHYTGYVFQPLAAAGGRGRGQVIVAAGGGPVATELLQTALTARAGSRLRRRTWRFLAAARSDVEQLRRHPGAQAGKVIIERNRADYASLLGNSAVSVSRAGYNTVLELLRARCRMVLVPFEGPGETEQLTRARSLAEKGLAGVLRESRLSPKRMARAIDLAAGRRGAALPALDCNGADYSVRLLVQMLARTR